MSNHKSNGKNSKKNSQRVDDSASSEKIQLKNGENSGPSENLPSLGKTGTNDIQGLTQDELRRHQMLKIIENQVLQAHSQLRQQINDGLEAIDKQVQQSLKDIREKAFEDLQKEQGNQKHSLNEKVFFYKESYLTEYFKIENYRTLYNMTVATLILLMLNLILTDYAQRHEIFDIETLKWCFHGVEKTILPLCVIFVLSNTIVPLTYYTIKLRINKITWITIYSLTLLLMMYISIYTCYINELGLASAMIIQAESVRMGLKMHAYLRTKILYCTENKFKLFVPAVKGSEPVQPSIPSIDLKDKFQELKRFLYFFFSPTLVYRDHYIQAPKRETKVIFSNFMNFLLCIYFGFILFKTFCKPQIIFFSQNMSFSSFLQVMFQLMLPGTLSIILLFFGLLHSWLNGWAELLRFPDRTFYLDWWNSREFGTYYRKWNMVVHEWLFYYVYGDIVRFSNGKVSKRWASLITFFISAVIHELILTCVLGFFYPILFVIFSGPGILLIQHQKRGAGQQMNILFWILMYLGTSMILTMYLTEYYARFKIPDSLIRDNWGIMAPIIPRTLYLL